MNSFVTVRIHEYMTKPMHAFPHIYKHTHACVCVCVLPSRFFKKVVPS